MLIPVSLAAPAVRFELTVGDLGDRRRSYRRGYGAPSLTRTNIVGLEGRLPGPSAGANWSGRTESNRPVPRWQRCRAPCAPAWAAQPRRDCGVTGWACTSYSGVKIGRA